MRKASVCGRALVEDYNHVFSRAPREIQRWIESGEFSAVTHVDVLVRLDLLGPTGFAEPDAHHLCLSLAGGAVANFLPHLAFLACLFVGPLRRAHSVWTKRRSSILPYDEFHAVVEAERGTAALGFSASPQPDGLAARIRERHAPVANLFETRLTFDRLRQGPKPLRSLLNGWEEARAIRRAASCRLPRKFTVGQNPTTGSGNCCAGVMPLWRTDPRGPHCPGKSSR